MTATSGEILTLTDGFFHSVDPVGKLADWVWVCLWGSLVHVQEGGRGYGIPNTGF